MPNLLFSGRKKLGKASRRKQKSFEGKEINQSVFEEGNRDSSSPFARYSFFISFFFIIITALLTYSNTFYSPFHFDDIYSIVENYQLRNLLSFWPPSGTRYIGLLSFAVNYHFWELDVFGYHLVNIIIHIINGILVWWLVTLTLKTPVIERTISSSQLKFFIASTVSLIFISHPVQTQAVTYIVQRFASLATLFYILSLALYIKARIINTGKRKHPFSPHFYFLISMLSAVFAMKTKEISFTLPLIIVFYEFTFFVEKTLNWKRIYYLIPFLLTLLIIPLSLIAIDKPVGEMIGELREAAQETGDISRSVYLLTQGNVIVTYIRLLFFPINQNLDYDYPLSHSLFEPKTFSSFVFLLAIFIFVIYLFVRSRKTNNGYGLLACFGIFWFFITLSVESSIIPIRDVIYEHRLYLPSVGAVITFSSTVFYGFSYAKKRLDIKASLLLATCILLLITVFPLGIATYKRNFAWNDEIMLWEDVVRKSPNKARGYSNLGLAHYKGGRMDMAIDNYMKALNLKPNIALIHNNLGLAYYSQNRIDNAMNEYQIAIQLAPNYAEVYGNMGNVHYSQGHIDDAIKEYLTVIRLKPDYPDVHNNLGSSYLSKGRIDDAIKEYKIALKLQPNYVTVYNNLGSAYFKQGNFDKAVEEYLSALKLKPNYPEAHNNLGYVYYNQGRFDEAIQEYLITLRLKPDYATAHSNLGKAHSKQGNFDKAIEEYLTVLKLNPNDTEARKAVESLSKHKEQKR